MKRSTVDEHRASDEAAFAARGSGSSGGTSGDSSGGSSGGASDNDKDSDTDEDPQHPTGSPEDDRYSGGSPLQNGHEDASEADSDEEEFLSSMHEGDGGNRLQLAGELLGEFADARIYNPPKDLSEEQLREIQPSGGWSALGHIAGMAAVVTSRPMR